MKMKFLILSLMALIIGLSACKKNKVDILYDKKYVDEIKLARNELAFYLTRNLVPGGTFAVASKGKIIYSEGIGLASKELDVRMERNNKLRIGEVSELFTSLIYHKLVEEGILHPDSTVQHYLPDFPKLNHKLTLDNLINQTSGIGSPRASEKNPEEYYSSIEKGIKQFQNDSLLFVPGYYQELNIFNYNLLGAVMEKSTEKRFSELLKEYVTDTLKLSNTVADNPFATIKGRAEFYDYNMISQPVNAIFRDLRYSTPSQGILSNAEDLVKFGMAILNSDYVSDELREKIFKPVLLYEDVPSTMANGWFLSKDQKGRVINGRNGVVTGGGATLLIYPEEELVVAGAINLTSKTEEIPVFNLAKYFLPEEIEETKIDKE